MKETYLLGSSGEKVTTVDAGGAWQRTDVYANGTMFATYDQAGLHFQLNDPLGTRRVQTNYQGWPELQCQSLPFGDQLTCAIPQGAAPTADDASSIHFTGKERDAESGNDYFGARYYASTTGRFLSPDPSGLYYANPLNPQSFNLFSYGRNNPMINTDPTGLDCVYINNDSGKYEGFASGDCDNSTTAKANSGYYVDGTVNSISFNSQNQVIGYGTTAGTQGEFDSFAGSTSSDAGPTSFSLNPYSNSISAGETVNVNGNSPAGSNTNSSSPTTLISPAGLQTVSNIHEMSALNRPPQPQLAGDPACFGAPGAVSDIHNLARGIAQNGPRASTDGQYGSAVWQNTARGYRPFGNEAADTGFNAGFMIGDYGLSLVNCLQGH